MTHEFQSNTTHEAVQLLADHVQLFDCSGSLKVSGDQHRLDAFFFQQLRKLATSCRLTTTLQPAEHDDGGAFAFQVQRRIDRAQDVDQFVIDDLDQLFMRPQTEQNPLAEGFLGHVSHEVLDDRIAHIGFEQRFLNDLQTVAHIAFGQLALTGQAFESRLQTFGEILKHRKTPTQNVAIARKNNPGGYRG